MNTAATRVNIGHVYPEHVAPPLAVMMEIKYCEQCGCPFSRERSSTVPYESKEIEEVWDKVIFRGKATYEFRGTRHVIRYKACGERFCKTHRINPVPDVESAENYKAQFPGTASQMGHRSLHMPRYDDSLGTARSHKSSNENFIKWRDALITMFRDKGELTCEQMQSCIPGCLTPAEARSRIWHAKAFTNLRMVRMLPSVTGRGRGPGVYVLLGVSPNTSIPDRDGELTVADVTSGKFTQSYIDQKLRDYFGK